MAEFNDLNAAQRILSTSVIFMCSTTLHSDYLEMSPERASESVCVFKVSRV